MYFFIAFYRGIVIRKALGFCSGGFSRPVPAVRGAGEVSVLKGNHEKIEIFLTAYFSPSAVAPSGLSDERTDEVVREEFSRVSRFLTGQNS